MSSETCASFLTIPTELRNAIYLYVFTPDPATDTPTSNHPPDLLATALELQHQPKHEQRSPSQLHILRSCRQIHDEANQLALSLTAFHVQGETSYPDCFALRASNLRSTKLTALRHITLTSRISHLRAMNEAWQGVPFGCPELDLETLTIVPTRADCSNSSYREVADLSQSHTLAYIFAETLKGLRNVRVVQVRNQGCFNEVVWKLVYRSLVYRMWRWGGGRCGVRFQCSAEDDGSEEGWFRGWLRDDDVGCEVGEEVMRLVGGSGEIPDPNVVGF